MDLQSLLLSALLCALSTPWGLSKKKEQGESETHRGHHPSISASAVIPGNPVDKQGDGKCGHQGAPPGTIYLINM